MKILDVKSLEIPEIKVIKYARFMDNRGFFTEQYRKSDLEGVGIGHFNGEGFVQANQSHSKEGVVRGMHFQWNPYMGKLVRTLTGNMVDMVLDIRKGSPTLGNLIAYDMPTSNERDYDELIWIPPGFAHGNFFTKESDIEYLCTGEYSKNCESGISPLSEDINWSLCDSKLRERFYSIINSGAIISDKDKNAQSLSDWVKDARSENFVYENLRR